MYCYSLANVLSLVACVHCIFPLSCCNKSSRIMSERSVLSLSRNVVDGCLCCINTQNIFNSSPFIDPSATFPWLEKLILPTEHGVRIHIFINHHLRMTDTFHHDEGYVEYSTWSYISVKNLLYRHTYKVCLSRACLAKNKVRMS